MKKEFLIFFIAIISISKIYAQNEDSTKTINLKEFIVYDHSNKTDSSSFGLFGVANLKDIPFSVNVINAKIIENTSSHNLIDALKTNPSVVPTLAPNNDERGLTNTTIRGFSPNYMLDGMAVNSYHIPLVENVEKIEVLNGLNSFFYGFSSFGGAINFITKKPVVASLANVSMGLYSKGIFYNNIDLGGAITKNKRLTYRLNNYVENGETYIKNQKQNKLSLIGSLNYQLLSNTNLRIDINHQNSLIEGQQNVFTVNPSKNIFLPSVSDFDAQTLYGQPWTYSKLRFTQVGISLDSKLSAVFKIRLAYRYGDAWWKYNYVVSSFTDNLGNYNEYDKDFGSNQRYYNSGYALVDATFNTFKIHHDITFGYSGNNTLIHFGGNPSTSILLGKFNLAKPVYVTMPDTIPSLTDNRTSYNQYYYHTVMFSDKITINKYISSIIGLSKAIYITKRTTGNMTQTGSADYTQNTIVPCVSLIVKPTKNSSIYGSYMQGVGIGGIAPDIAKNAGEMLNPNINEQIEIGAKAIFKKINMSLAFFKINAVNEYIDPTDSIYKQDGREVHQGVELNFSGTIFKNLFVIGGISIMDVKVTRALNNPKIEGKIPQNVPLNNLSLLLEYSIPFVKGISVSAGGTYCDKRPVDATNLEFINSYYILDAGVRFKTLLSNRNTTFNLSVNNLLNTKYFASYTSTGIRLGLPRMVSISAKIEL